MQQREELLAREEPVGNDPHEEGRHQRRDRGRAVRRADLRIREMERLSEVRAHRDEPHAPNEVLQEHHRRQLRSNAVHGSSLMRMFRKASSPVWSPCSAICPFFARPKFGHVLNLLALTFATQSALPNSNSTILKPLSQCSTCGP